MSGRNPAQFRSVVTEILYGNTGSVSVSSVAANTTGTTTVSVPGVAIGDFVLALACNLTQTAGLTMTAEVTAADTVTIKFANPTVGALVPVTSATYTVIVAKVQPQLLT